MNRKRKTLFVVGIFLLYLVTSFVFAAENRFTCEDTGFEYGTFDFYEACHSPDGTEDEDWTCDNYSDWGPYNRTDEWSGQWTYSHNNSGDWTFNWTMLNNSGMNRTQTLMNYHWNASEGSNLTAGYIIGNISKDFYYIGVGENLIEFLYYNGSWYDVYSGNDVNISNSSSFDFNLTNWFNIAPTGVYADTDWDPWSFYWETAPSYQNGSWMKMIYNGFCDHMQFKCWGDPTAPMDGLFHEPSGWAIDEYASYLDNETPCLGVGYHNPDKLTVRVDYDIMVFYQENYSLNTTEQTTLYPEGYPYMEFNMLNASRISENLTNFFNESYLANMSSEDVADLLMNITNATTKNSRPYVPFDDGDVSYWEQNDTVRYYTTLLYNCTDAFEFAYDQYLWIYIHQTPYGPTPSGHYQDAAVMINVDGDDTWDDNDRLWFITTDGIKWEWQGPHFNTAFNINASIWVSNSDGLQNMHRYFNHTHASFLIPTSQLIKENGEPLNVTDVFNISIFTGASFDDNLCWWQNWNETNCSARYEENLTVSKQYYMNETGLEEDADVDINGTNIDRWGQGEITGTASLLENEYQYQLNVTKYANITAVPYGNTYYHINYSIWLNNTGTGDLTDIYINDTWFNCSCSDFNATFVSSNENSSNFTWHNDSCYWILRNVSLEPMQNGDSWHFWYIINVTNCTAITYGTLQNNVTVNATQLTTDVTATDTVSWGTYATRFCVNYITQITDIGSIGNSVFAVIGILLIIGSILLIIGLMYTKGLIKR